MPCAVVLKQISAQASCRARVMNYKAEFVRCRLGYFTPRVFGHRNAHLCSRSSLSSQSRKSIPSALCNVSKSLGFLRGFIRSSTTRGLFAAVHPEQYDSSNASPLKQRESLREHAAIYQFRVKGVSYDKRQEPVQGLDPGMLVRLRQSSHCTLGFILSREFATRQLGG